MANGLWVNLSMEWQREQLACANAFPAKILGSAQHGIAVTNTLKATTAGDMILVFRRYMQIAMSQLLKTPDFIGSSIASTALTGSLTFGIRRIAVFQMRRSRNQRSRWSNQHALRVAH